MVGRLLFSQYDVFVSFNGSDLRWGFVDCLYDRLNRAGISVFRDEEEILSGGELEVSLSKPIDHSMISIPIISEDFVSSKFCLDELKYMLRCRVRGRHMVVPIFYYVSPSKIEEYVVFYWVDKIDRRTFRAWKMALLEITGIKAFSLPKDGSSWSKLFDEVVAHVQRLLIMINPRENYAKLVWTRDNGEEMMEKLGAVLRDGQLVSQYDVFVSFSRSDMCRGFVDCLSDRLRRAGISVITDKEEVLPGEEIDVSLTEAIDPTKISIPVISQDFLFSRPCLQELTHMLQRRRREGRVVIPIFCHISPSKIEEDTSSFRRHWVVDKKIERVTLETWKAALLEITRTQGYTLPKHGRSWGKLCDEVVADVQQYWTTRELRENAKLVGTDEYVEEMMGKLGVVFRDGQAVELCGEDVRFIGIYGMPGLGKTALAKAVFHKIHHLFDCCSFLKDIDENIGRERVISLQEKLISDLEKQGRKKLSSRAQGIKILRYRFCRERVLIILDNVHNSEQIKQFAVVRDWFGPGSRIILTTSSQNVLHDLKETVSEKLEVQPLGDYQALKLLWRHASVGGPHSGDDYDSAMSSEICEELRGLPLAIEIVGSFLSKNISEWRVWTKMKDELKAKDEVKVAISEWRRAWAMTQDELKENLDDKVQVAVAQSYHKLGKSMKEIFLDIACFSNGKDAKIASYMWDACGYNPFDGIAHLQWLSLVKIEEDNELWMHDKVRDFGRAISQETSSRFWNPKHSLSALKERKGDEEIEALDLGTDCQSVNSLTSEEFGHLSKLRLLSLGNFSLRGNFEGLLSNLMWLDWQGCSEAFEIDNLDLKNLVILNLSWSKVTRDWKGWREIKMEGLKVLNLTGCTNLLVTPEFSGYPKLEILILAHCSRLVEVHRSICELKFLICLNLKFCKGLNILPKGLGKMGALEELSIDGTSIKEIPDINKLRRLKRFSASNCSFVSKLPYSTGLLGPLKVLLLTNANITELPDSIGNFQLLQKLSLRDCSQLRKLPESIGTLRFLSELDVSWTGILDLPDLVTNLQNLRVLRLDFCYVRKLPDDIGRLSFLEEIYASGCRNLQWLPQSIRDLSRLRILRLQYSSISSIPSEIHSLSSLEIFDLLHCDMLEKLPTLRSSSSKSHLSSHYDVFLSSEGSVTCNEFSDILYARLTDVGFSVFRDIQAISVEEIQPVLHEAINRSGISIPIISRGYAFNKSCLTELVRMLDCKRRRGLKIIPIFCDVFPSDIISAFDLYWEDQVKLGPGSETIKMWREALLEIRTVTEYVLQETGRYEGEKRTIKVSVPRTENPPADGYIWTKYGQKEIFGSRFPRTYYRCIHQKLCHCPANKRVRRLDDDPFTFRVTYRYDHTCSMSSTAPSIPPLPPSPPVLAKTSTSAIRNEGEKRTMKVAAPEMGNTEIPPEDGYVWRKYGQKEILGSRFPRAYYRCSQRQFYACPAKKQVQPLDDDPSTFEVTYRYDHTCHMSSTTPSIPTPRPSPLPLPPLSTTVISSQEELIRKVVDAVVKLLEKQVLPVTDKLVGIDAHVEEIMRKLGIVYRNGRAIEVRDDAICAVGICGVPGVGKTTLAKVVYNKINHLFQAFSFLGGIQERSRHGELMSLQKQLSSDLNRAYGKLDSIDQGRKRVLIVLDDLHNCEEVKALAADNSGFGPGSRIMITTRDQNALSSLQGGEQIHEVEPMTHNLALKLFFKHALKGNPQQATEEVQTLSKHIIEVIGGLPLAIEDVGSQLYGRKGDIWKERLSKFRRRPDLATVAAFWKTFECLDFVERQIFLDIACFFSGKDWRILYYMWDACGYHHSHDSLNLLCKFSLVKIGENNEVCMNDELQKFGKEIVRNEDPEEPWRCSRLWRHEDAKIMLKQVKGNENVKGVAFEYENICDSFTEEEFSGLSNLRFLKLGNADIGGNFGKHLPNLKWLEWQGCPTETTEQCNLNLEKLVILDFSGSRVTQHWIGWKWIIEKAKALKVLKLTSCVELAKSPDFTAPMKVERLDLESCCQLSEILPSVSNLESLVSLNVKHCRLIVHLPELSPLKALEELLIDGTSIDEILIPEGALHNLKILTARQCKHLRHIPRSIGQLMSLTCLVMHGAIEIEEIPESISLLENLQTLSLRDCRKVSSLPGDIGKLKSLHSMDLSGTSIIELPSSLWDLENLRVLKMEKTPLREFPLSIINLKKLEEIDFSYCWHLEGEIPSNIIQLCRLRILKVSFTGISSLPESICELFYLRTLDLHGCEKLATFPSFPSNINVVY